MAACLRVDSTPTPGQGDVSLQNNKSTVLSAQRAVSAEAQAIAKRLPFVVVPQEEGNQRIHLEKLRRLRPSEEFSGEMKGVFRICQGLRARA